MTKEEFIQDYCNRSDLSWEWLSKYKIALPCACGEDECDGWAMVSIDPITIKDHIGLYAPKVQITSP
jgi:hypothetical protein